MKAIHGDEAMAEIGKVLRGRGTGFMDASADDLNWAIKHINTEGAEKG